MAHGYPDYEGEKSGLYLKPEWAAKEGTDKNMSATAAAQAPGGFSQLSYTVPNGRTLYVTQFNAAIYAAVVGDAELNQMCLVSLWIGASQRYQLGANGGGLWVLSKPLTVTETKVLNLFCHNSSAHTCHLYGGMGGYEVIN